MTVCSRTDFLDEKSYVTKFSRHFSTLLPNFRSRSRGHVTSLLKAQLRVKKELNIELILKDTPPTRATSRSSLNQ